ncbi:hypothetical protein [Rudanella paleaurantiibacter]|nr:hypothetical protein [Rudanella paleaurantiibacter]
MGGGTVVAVQYDHAEKAVTLVDGTVLYASRRGGQDLRNYLNRPYDQKGR